MNTPEQEKKSKEDEERGKRLDEILKRQSELDVLRPVGSRKYKNWTEVPPKRPDGPSSPF